MLFAGFLRRVFLGLSLLIADGCSSSEPEPVSESPAGPSAQTDSDGEPEAEPEPEAIKNPAITACISHYRADGGPGGGIDPAQFERDCRQVVDDLIICDPTTLIDMQAAVCIAQASGLPLAENWSTRLWLENASPHRVTWKIVNPDLGEERLIDARSGMVLGQGDQWSTPLGAAQPRAL